MRSLNETAEEEGVEPSRLGHRPKGGRAGFEPGAVTYRLALPESIKLQGRDSNPHAVGASLTVRCVYHFATLE